MEINYMKDIINQVKGNGKGIHYYGNKACEEYYKLGKWIGKGIEYDVIEIIYN